jgi:hypothetical protein
MIARFAEDAMALVSMSLFLSMLALWASFATGGA